MWEDHPMCWSPEGAKGTKGTREEAAELQHPSQHFSIRMRPDLSCLLCYDGLNLRGKKMRKINSLFQGTHVRQFGQSNKKLIMQLCVKMVVVSLLLLLIFISSEIFLFHFFLKVFSNFCLILLTHQLFKNYRKPYINNQE